MKQIQWFPGHMSKSIRQIKEKLNLIDVVIEIVDARIPFSSSIPNLAEIVKNKPRVILLNKIDLADKNILNQWKEYFLEKGILTLGVQSNKSVNINEINKVCVSQIERNNKSTREKKLLNKKFRAMIVGIPNVGKSTFINALAKKRSTKVGNMPGVTKGQQWIKLDSFEVLDTPGILWGKFESDLVAHSLALTGAIKDKILPLDDVFIYGMRYITSNYKGKFESFYNYDSSIEDVEEIYEHIGRKRGCLMRGNIVNYDRVSEIVLKDIRSANIGNMCFEKPSDFSKK